MALLNENLANLRRKNKLTQEELGERLGVSAQSISKWENNISMPDICLLPLIAETLGVSIDELFGFGNGRTPIAADDFPEKVHAQLLENIASWFGESDAANKFKEYTDKRFENAACAIFTRDGAVFENKSIGIVFPKAPEEAIKLLGDSDAREFLSLLQDPVILRVIEHLALARQFATVASISAKCTLPEDAVHDALERIKRYQLVRNQTVDLEDESIEIWRIQRTHALFFVYSIIQIAKHASQPVDNYFYYHGNDLWCY
ncbi:MAG: helix-turn-helix transcriptional regulator [Clostridia bacterium]|nr:helix-turn-helix transcriptional regulator [Clostridia bacterium]